MDNDDFEYIVDHQLELCCNTLKAKNDAYAANGDVFNNFKQAGTLTYQDPKISLAGMMVKHTVSLYDMISSDDRIYTIPEWEEKITDHINYLLLLKGLIVEQEQDRKLEEFELIGETFGEHILGGCFKTEETTDGLTFKYYPDPNKEDND